MNKRNLLICMILIVSILPGLSANTTRMEAMGGAFTAIGDDANTINANPAGLAFINRSRMEFSNALEFSPSFQLPSFTPPEIAELGGITPYDLRYRYDVLNPIQYYDWETGSYYTEYDGTSYNDILSAMGFASNGTILTSDDFYEMVSWYDATTALSLLDSYITSVGYIPSFSYVDRNFGFSFSKGYALEGTPGTSGEIILTGSERYSTGLAQRLGIFAIGGSVSYVKDSSIALSVPQFSEYETYCDDLSLLFGTDDPDELGMMLMTGEVFEGGNVNKGFAFGIGSMVNIGSLTVGAAIEDISPLLDTGYRILSHRTADAAWEIMNVGLAYESNNRKNDYSENFFNLLLAADLHNVGDDSSRSLHIGSEFGVSLAEVITADIRAGYSQPLPGRLSDVLDVDMIDLDEGTYTFGIGTKVFIAQVDLAFSIPSLVLKRAYGAALSSSEISYEELTAGLSPEAAPSFTISGSVVF